MGQQAMYIGLGGAGMKTVAHLKAKLLIDHENNGDINKLTQNNNFIFIDTDEHCYLDLISDNNLRKSFNGNSPISYNEYINLGDTNPFALVESALTNDDINSKRLLEWATLSDLPYRPLRCGSGASRMAGRVAIFNHWEAIIHSISVGLSKFNVYDHNNNMNELNEIKPTIWVFASSNGGTGSSSVLDVLYIVDRLYRANFNSEPYLRLVLYMPQPFIEKNEGNVNYYLNAFSSFWELNAFRHDWANNNDGNKFKYFSARLEYDTWQQIRHGWSVYSYMIPIDAYTNSGYCLSVEDMYDRTATICYYLQKSSGAGTAVGALDNDLKDVEITNNPRTDANTPFKWTKSLVAAGYKELCKPDNLLKEYIRVRLLYDMFNYGLLGYELKDIHESGLEIQNIKEIFADEHILRYLTNENFEGSLFSKVRNEFQNIKLPVFEREYPRANEWEDIWPYINKKIEQKEKDLLSKFGNDHGSFSERQFMDLISSNIDEAVEKSILKHGLRYTNHLLYLVDDQHLKIIAEEFKHNLSNSELELKELRQKIERIQYSTKTGLFRNEIKKAYPELKRLIHHFKELTQQRICYTLVIKILENLTKSNGGYLEVLRSGNSSHKGLKHVMDDIIQLYHQHEYMYVSLSRKFKNTKRDEFTVYVPDVGNYTSDAKDWIDNHYFEMLYDEGICSLDNTGEVKRLGKQDMGKPPIRNSNLNNQNNLENILMKIHNEMPTDTFFVNLAIQQNEKYSMDSFISKISEYVESKFTENNLVHEFLTTNIETFFDRVYNNNQLKDQFAYNFLKSIPVLYPTKYGTMSPINILLFIGNDIRLAAKLGYNLNNASHQFIQDNEINDKFIVMKLEIGHNLFDYKYFDEMQECYMEHKKLSASLLLGCHIHKEFVHLDLDKITSYVDKYFLELGFYDSFFQKLALEEIGLDGVELYESLFQTTSGKTDAERFMEGLLKGKDTTKTSENQENLLAVTPIGAKTFQLKCAKLKYESKKIEIVEIKEYNFETDDFEVFCKELKSFSKNYLDAIKVIKKALDNRSAFNKSKYLTLFEDNFESITADAISNLLETAIEKTFDDSLHKHIDLSFEIRKSIEGFRSNNIFKKKRL